MGFLLWAALTGLALAAGLAATLRLGSALRIGEQVVAAIIVAITLVAIATQVLGYTSLLYAWPLGGLVALESVLLLVFARPETGAWRAFRERLRSAAVSGVSPVSLVTLLPAAALVLYLAAYVWLLPSWAWDALWYHNPTTAYAFQDHSLRWHQAPPNAPFINAFPKLVELLGLWNVIFAPDDRLIDGVQLPMALMGVVALAALCRRAGASAAVSLGLGACWLLIPAVFLNIPSSYNDVAIGSLRLAAILFLARTDAVSAHRLFGALALGLYVGSKNYGAVHAALLAVIVVGVLWAARRRGAITTRRAWAEAGGMAATVLVLGGATYLRNLWEFGNPVWPAKLSVFGHELSGTWALSRFNRPPWGGNDDLHALWRSFTYWHPQYEVDVRAGGFGPLWVFVLLPLLVIALVAAIARMKRGLRVDGALAALMLATTALLTTASWWPRHTLGFPAAGLLGAALLAAWVPRAWLGQGLLVSITLFAVIQGKSALPALRAPPSLLAKAAAEAPIERDAIRLGKWQAGWIGRREEVLQPGDAAIYDESVSFTYPLWRHDWQNRVLFRPLRGSPAAWLAELDADHVRWAAVRKKSIADTTLKNGGWIFLSACPIEPCNVWVKPESGRVDRVATGHPRIQR